MTLTRRQFTLAGTAGAALCALTAPASAQADWPTKNITLVAPTLPGSTGDIIVRTVAQKMSQLMGHPVITDNKPGAGGTLGVGFVGRNPPDAHMAVITGTGPFILGPLLNKRLSYDMEKNFEPVSLMSTFSSVAIVSMDSPYKTMKDFIAAARAQPGKLNFASAGNGTLIHLQGELLKIRAGIDMAHVPYKSEPPGIQAVMTQEAAIMILPSASAHNLITQGKLRALAVTSDVRMKTLPDVPTMAEAGVPDFVVKGWYGAYAPAGSNKAHLQRFSAEMRRALQSPDVAARFASLGMEVVGTTPEQQLATWRADMAIWTQVLKANPQITLEQ